MSPGSTGKEPDMTTTRVENDRVVVLEYRLTDEQGREFDSSSSGSPITYIHGRGQILPGLEAELGGREVGDEATITVAPEAGFGPRHDELVVEVARSQFSFEIAAGSVVQAQLPDGRSQYLQVLEVTDESVTLDGNHPLAGRTLYFEVRVEDVREATADELAGVEQPKNDA